MKRSRILQFILCAICLVTPRAAVAITIPTVLVGDVGNPFDQDGLHSGTVNYEYRIGTYEVTIGQYAAFLNAVAADDTHDLYELDMTSDLNVAGIARSGTPGSYSYSVIGSPNKPITNVNFRDALRFCNWLHNGQPSGAQDASTTENGAYALPGTPLQISRTSGARWFLPTENEWYKAAYYQPAAQGGDVDGYWTYPTRSNTKPYSDQPPGLDAPTQSNTVNTERDDAIANGYDDGFAVTGNDIHDSTQNYLTDVGAYTQSSSHYGTFDQAGNVMEWNETRFQLQNQPRTRIRGGAFDLDSDMAASYNYMARGIQVPLSDLGFRVAAIPSVPEPSTLAIAALGILGLLIATRRKR